MSKSHKKYQDKFNEPESPTTKHSVEQEGTDLEKKAVSVEKKQKINVDNATTEKTEDEKSTNTHDEEINEIKDRLLRTVAEFDNYKKRTLKEKAELILNGSEKTITAILPIIDDMQRAIANANASDDINVVNEGWKLIYKKFVTTLESIGVKQIETQNADFNVDYHEAIAMVPAPTEDAKGKVIDCVQTGYMLNDRVIRHAKVAVGQ